MKSQTNKKKALCLSFLGDYHLRKRVLLRATVLSAFLVFGLSQAYAQEIRSVDQEMASLSEGNRDAMATILYGNANVCRIQDGSVVSGLPAEGSVKTVRLSGVSDFSAFAALSDHYGSIEAVSVKVKGNGAVQLDYGLLSQLTELRYVIVVFDEYLSETEVRSKFSQSNSAVDWVILYSVPE